LFVITVVQRNWVGYLFVIAVVQRSWVGYLFVITVVQRSWVGYFFVIVVVQRSWVISAECSGVVIIAGTRNYFWIVAELVLGMS
jgi:predicted DNA-binding transcriptional regulator